MAAKAAEEREIFDQRRRARSQIKSSPSNVSVTIDGEIQAVKRFCREHGLQSAKFLPKANGRTQVTVPDESSAAKVRLFSYGKVPGWK